MSVMPMPGPAAPPPMPQQAPPGPTQPATVPPVPAGQMQAGRVKIMLALQLLEKGLPDVGAASPEGKAVVESLGKLTKIFGVPAPDLGAASLKMLGAEMDPNAGPAPSEQDAMGNVQSKVQERLAGLGMGGAPTGGAPAPPGMPPQA